jgi:hypothetical protein
MGIQPQIGDPAWEQRIEAIARRLYPRHVCGPEAIHTLQGQVRDEAALIRTAGEANDPVIQARAGSTMVWLAGKICLSRLGIGPVREDQWHDLLQRAALPFDAATPFARWHLGTSLTERLEAAFSLAEQTLGEPLPRTPLPADRRLSLPPAFEPRAKPDAAEAVEMHRLIKAVGFGKMAKAVWKRDAFCHAWEAGTIVWFAVPACLALGNLGRPELHWWHVALSQVTFSFDAATLYARALTADSVEARTTAACELGQGTLDALEPIFRNTRSAHTYRRR